MDNSVSHPHGHRCSTPHDRWARLPKDRLCDNTQAGTRPQQMAYFLPSPTANVSFHEHAPPAIKVRIRSFAVHGSRASPPSHQASIDAFTGPSLRFGAARAASGPLVLQCVSFCPWAAGAGPSLPPMPTSGSHLLRSGKGPAGG